MTDQLGIRSPRMVLVAATAELAQLERKNVRQLGELLGAHFPSAWPPPLNDDESIQWMIDFLCTKPSAAGWALWYFLKVAENNTLVAVGNGGFKGEPSADGTVEIGYSIMENFQRNGFAPEAVVTLIRWAFHHPNVQRVIAHTLPDLKPSIRVLEKCGFRFLGDGPQEGVIVFECLKQPTK